MGAPENSAVNLYYILPQNSHILEGKFGIADWEDDFL
jgi:hypothetical protein